MRIIIDNQTKDLTDNTCLINVYNFLNDTKILEDFTIFNDVMPIMLNDYICIVRRLKNGFSFKFKNIVRENKNE